MSFGPPNRALGPPKASTLIVVAEFPVRVISDVLSGRQPLPLCPRFQTYRCLTANNV